MPAFPQRSASSRDQNSIRDRQDFRQIEEITTTALPASASSGWRVYLRDRADVDATSRFIEDDDLRFLGECLGDYDFLLVPAGIFEDLQAPLEAETRAL